MIISTIRKTIFGLLLLLIYGNINAQVLTPKYNTQTAPNSFGYYEYLPQGYNPSGGKLYPVILFLCGVGETGSGNTNDLYKVLVNGTPKLCNQGAFPTSFTVGGTTQSFIVITPQFTVGFPTNNDINSVLDYILQHYKADPDRIYLTGLSSGGGVTWSYPGSSAAYAKRIAAIVPVCGAHTLSQSQANTIGAENVAVWATHNLNDGTVSSATTNYNVTVINNSPTPPNPLAKATIFYANGHDAWTTTYDVNYRENGLNIYEWMLQYKKSGNTNPPNQPPAVNAGTDQAATLPANTVTLSGSASDPDGTISSTAWTKISGPSQYSIASPGSLITSVTNLTAGTYVFRLTATDNKGATASDDVVVIENSAAINQPPAVNAGADQTATLPNNTVTLSGSASDPDGYISSIVWTKVSGPSQYTLVSQGSVISAVSNLTAGNYVFRLIITDNQGATASDDVNVTVNNSSSSGNGLSASYYNNMGLSGTPVLSRTDATVNFNWQSGSPGSQVTVDKFSVRWTGQVKADQTGAYTFYVNSDDGARLYVNNQLIIDQWVDKAASDVSGTIALTANTLYDIKLEYYENQWDASCAMSWSAPGVSKQVIPSQNLFTSSTPPSNTNGLSASYYNNMGLSGTPVLSRTDATVNFNWQSGSPGSQVTVDKFSVRWTGQVKADQTGAYTFYVNSDDGARLYVNNQLIIDQWIDKAASDVSGTIALTANTLYDIKLEYYENQWDASCAMSWSAPGVSKQVIPSQNLFTSSTTPPSTTNGLSATYYNNMSLSGTPALSRTDATVNFNWLNGSPDPQVTVDRFSVRWTGQVKADQTGAYTFYVNSDDGTRLYVNNQLIIDSWVDKAASDASGTIYLIANTLYDIKLEYYENQGGASCAMSWSAPGVSKQVIPSQNLFTIASTGTPNMLQTVSGFNNIQDGTGGNLLRGISVYPNPVRNTITLSLQNDKEGEGEIKIYDMLGRIQSRYSINKQSGYFTKQINMSDKTPGIYIIKVSIGNKTELIKIVKD